MNLFKFTDDKFHLAQVSNGFICKQLLKLKASKATGLDGLPSKLLKDSAVTISILITHIVSLSITSPRIYLKIGNMPRLFLHTKMG